MIFFFGILVAASSLVAAVMHLNQEVVHFWDFVAFTCVSGGTTAVALMTFPWQYRSQVLQALWSLLYSPARNDGQLILNCMEFFKLRRSGGVQWNRPIHSLADEILRDGAELIDLGFSREKVHEILEERIFQAFERAQKISNAFRSLAKYPPAFGLAGTVLGLVSLMRKVSEGADAKQTGLMMAIALMATFYGLLTANLLISPAGERLAKNALEERKSAELALHTVLMLAEGSSLLEAQESLNSYVMKNQRINLLDVHSREAA